jgi:hypothetical protein
MLMPIGKDEKNHLHLEDHEKNSSFPKGHKTSSPSITKTLLLLLLLYLVVVSYWMLLVVNGGC